jgi:glycosyltransferase involved in cell wall biosynthesis
MNHGIKGFLFGKLMMQLRMWDYETAQKNTILLANSTTTQERIWKYYRRTCRVLYPPIETQRFASSIEKLDTNNPPYYIILSALTEFKRIDIAIQHFPNKQDLKLYII